MTTPVVPSSVRPPGAPRRRARLVVCSSRPVEMLRGAAHTKQQSAAEVRNAPMQFPGDRFGRNSPFSSEMSADANRLPGAPRNSGVRSSMHALRTSARTSMAPLSASRALMTRSTHHDDTAMTARQNQDVDTASGIDRIGLRDEAVFCDIPATQKFRVAPFHASPRKVPLEAMPLNACRYVGFLARLDHVTFAAWARRAA